LEVVAGCRDIKVLYRVVVAKENEAEKKPKYTKRARERRERRKRDKGEGMRLKRRGE